MTKRVGDEQALDAAFDGAAKALERASKVALACHVNPDPDAVGSMLGLAGYLSERGKEVVCSWGNDPLVRPRWLSVLDGAVYLVEPKEFPKEPDLLVSLDTAAPDRLGILAPNAERAALVIVIDHHRTNPGFGNIVVLDPASSSTAEMVFRLVERMGGRLPDGAAACLYAGVIADTGRFMYEATTPETLRVAAELRRHGFDHARLGQALFEDGSLGYLKVAGIALDRLEHVPDAGLVWTYVLQSDLSRSGISMGDTDDLIDLVRMAREADVSCVIKQQRDGWFKVSLRSRGRTDVGAVCQAFGGGGHRLAAGYTSQSGLEETVKPLVQALTSARTAAGRA
ncbi:MAG TPA: bifunctional oligoribonuclease/PAP phosphatase NrnA, partial [Actinomycetota bacterium]|nr:bifunctional oligoribonuclease/PAP phosphatase NrnA [Actinomycetota bacterium]